MSENLRNAFDEALPHLLAAGRELIAAYHAFIDALAEGPDPRAPRPVERVTID
jgi:hypothetical protein